MNENKLIQEIKERLIKLKQWKMSGQILESRWVYKTQELDWVLKLIDELKKKEAPAP